MRFSEIALEFADSLAQVSISAFTVELGSIDVEATIPVSLTRTIVSSAHIDGATMFFPSHTCGYTIRPDDSIFIDLNSAPNLWTSVAQYSTLVGAAVGEELGASWSFNLIIERLAEPGAAVRVRVLGFGTPAQEISGQDPVTASPIKFRLNGPGVIQDLGQIAIVPEPLGVVLLGLVAGAAALRLTRVI